MNNEIQDFSTPEVSEVYSHSNYLEQGMIKTQTPYSTALQVIKPRNLNLVVNKCIEEAAIAGDDFYYSWSQGGSIIEGLTVGGALAIARNFGNCAVDTKVDETPDSYTFYGAFIDLETGFNLVRPFRQNKQSPKKKNGEDIYTGERGKDIIFQIGASKAIRNVVLNAVPKWLSSKVISKAKENVVGIISKMGTEKAREMVIKKLTALKIDIARVEFAYGLQKSWDIEKLVMLSSAVKSIENGYESIDSIFPKSEKEAQPDLNNIPKVNNMVAEQPKTEPTSEVTEPIKEPEQKVEFTEPKSVIDISKAMDLVKTREDLSAYLKKFKSRIKAIADSNENAQSNVRSIIAAKENSFN